MAAAWQDLSDVIGVLSDAVLCAACLRVSHEPRQINSALMVFKNVSPAALGQSDYFAESA